MKQSNGSNKKNKKEFFLRKRKARKRSKKKHLRAKRQKKLLKSRPETVNNRPSVVIDHMYMSNFIQSMSGNYFWLNYRSAFQWRNAQMESEAARRLYPHYGAKDVTPEAETLGHQEESDEDSDEFEISPEMMEFIEVGMKFQAQREKEKEEYYEKVNKNGNKEKSVSERDAIEECATPIQSIQNKQRIEEMKELYGAMAPKIHGMETSIELSFNRNVDQMNPPYWPILPFNFKFKR